MVYDYSQFYKTKSPAGYDIFKSGGQKLAYEEALPMFKSGFNVEFIKEQQGIPQSGGIGSGVPIGQSAAVSAQQRGLAGVPTGGVAGAPTFTTPVAPAPTASPTTPINLGGITPSTTSDTLSSSGYRSQINALLDENRKRQSEIQAQQDEYRKAIMESMTPTTQETTAQGELNVLGDQLTRLANQERKMDFGFLPEEYLKTEKGLRDVGVSEAQLQRRIATEQAPIKRSFTDQRLDLLSQVESRQKALGLETAKREGVFEKAKTLLGFTESDMNRVNKMFENQLQVEQNILDYAFKLDTRSQQGLGTILKAFENTNTYFEKMSPESQQGVLNMARQFGIDQGAVIAGINAQVDGNMIGNAKTMLDKKSFPEPIIDKTGTTLEFGTPEYVIERLKQTAGSKTKPVASEREQLGKFANVVALTDNLMNSLNTTTNDPIVGYLRSLNPYDFDARAVNAQVTALVPSVARALYGEVGVLTDTDIERYLKTLPNIKSTKEQNKFIAAMTLSNARRAYEQTLLNLASSNVNVSGFADSYKNLTDRLNKLDKELGTGGQTQNATAVLDSILKAPAPAPKKESIFNKNPLEMIWNSIFK